VYGQTEPVETDGLSDTVRPLLAGVLGIPEHNDVESLGVAGAGAAASFELAAGVTTSADQYCTCVTGAPAACRDGR
jgi:hypothetical protein